MKLPTGNTRSASIAKKISSGTSPGTATIAPARSRLQDRVQPLDVGNARMRQPEQVDPIEKGRDHARTEQVHLPREQEVPDRMIVSVNDFPALRDDIVLPDLSAAGPWRLSPEACRPFERQ